MADCPISEDIVQEPLRSPAQPGQVQRSRTGQKTIERSPQVGQRLAPVEFAFSTDDALDTCLGDIQWLWDGYVPLGFPTLLAGDQGQGKSTVALALLRALIMQTNWPDGTPVPDISAEQKYLWIDTEGGLAMFRQKLIDWGMPRGRFIFPKDSLQELMLDNPHHWDWLEMAIERFKPPLVVIDSLSGAHRGEENKSDSMKPIMKGLAELAQRRRIAVVVIHHLNKAPVGVPDYPITLGRLRGSSTITQFCRSVLVLGTPNKEQPESRRLDCIKMNLARLPAPVGYILTDGGPAWGNAPDVPQPRRAVDDALAFLRDALEKGYRPSDEVKAAASSSSSAT